MSLGANATTRDAGSEIKNIAKYSTKSRQATLGDINSMLGDYTTGITGSNSVLSNSQDALSGMVAGASGQGALTSLLTGGVLADLGLGSDLSDEQTRDATQAAREGLASRGMAGGNNAIGTEILARDSYGQQRKQQRIANALSVSSMNNSIVQGGYNASMGLSNMALGSLTGAGAQNYLSDLYSSNNNAINAAAISEANNNAAILGALIGSAGKVGGAAMGGAA